MSQADWPRYIFASVADYFRQIAATANVPLHIEHLDERTESLMRKTDRAELRIVGPYLKHVSKNYWVAYVDASILIFSRYDGPAKGAYNILRIAGTFVDAMDAAIGVWNYGDQPGDFADVEVFIGCLNPRPGQTVQVNHFGQTAPDEKSKITEVSAKWMIELSE